MNTPTLTQRKALAKAWKNYVAVRRAYCQGKATVQQLAYALALVGVAEVKADIASVPAHTERRVTRTVVCPEPPMPHTVEDDLV